MYLFMYICVQDDELDDDDPCITIAFNSDDEVHECLQKTGRSELARHNNILTLEPAPDAQGSKANLVEWLNSVVKTFSPDHTMCTDTQNKVIAGKYTGLRNTEFVKVLNFLNSSSSWISAIDEGNNSAGAMMVTFGGEGRGGSKMSDVLAGPFRGEK